MSDEQTPAEERWARLDLRSLALYRMALGLLLLVDLVSRVPGAKAFYTDQGVLPRLLLTRSEFGDDWLCFHLGVGDATGEIILLILQMGLAVGVLLGWRTRFSVLASWFLLNSLHVRNPFVNDRGDLEIVLLLFWGFFLPLGSRWSLDARAGRTATGASEGLAPAALVLQIAAVYLCAGFLKNGDFWLVRGDGLAYSLQSPLFATSAAGALAGAPQLLLKMLNYGVIAGEIFAGLLLLCPYNVSLLRGTAVIVLALFHGGVLVLFRLGLFPWVGFVSLIALLPAEFWLSRAGQRLERFFQRRLGSGESKPSGSRRWELAVIGLALVLCALSNAANRAEGEAFKRPAPVVWLTGALRLEQHWDLFSPIPPYIGHFELTDSAGKSLLAMPRVAGVEGSVDFPSHRWRMVMIASLYPRFAFLRPGLVKLLAPDSPEPVHYRFRVRLVDGKGVLQPETTWNLL